MRDIAGRADRFQRRFRPVSVPLAIIYKFFDDQGNYLAAAVTYYSFIAIFPVLLLASSVLGFVLQGNPDLQAQILKSALAQFPIIGEQLTAKSLTGSTTAIVLGFLTALYGALGLGMALQNVSNTAWSVPRNSRPNPLLLRVKSLLLLLTAGIAVLAVVVVSTVGGNVQQLFGARIDWTLKLAIVLVTILVVGLVLTLLFRVSAARDHRLSRAAPGGFVTATLWMGLQYGGAAYVTHVLAKSSSEVNKTFGLVLGLLAFIYIAAVMAVIGIETNVVLARRLFPRALLTPFTDSVELTEADRRAYTSYALMQRHKGFETVEVSFDKRGADRAGPGGQVGPVELHAVPDPPQEPEDRLEQPDRAEGPAVS